MIDLSSLQGQTTFITGSGKNVGKTTLLCHLLKKMRSFGPVLVGSIGVDGEKQDAITGQLKPAIELASGDWVMTTLGAVQQSAGFFEVCAVLPHVTAMGPIVVARALRATKIELIGPETNRQLADAVSCFKREQGAVTVLIDGAVNRLTQVAEIPGCGYIEVVQIGPQNYRKVLNYLVGLDYFAGCAQWRENSPLKVQRITGALTLQRLQLIPDDVEAIIVDDFTKVFVVPRQIHPKKLFFMRPLTPHAIVVNPRSIDVAKLRQDIAAENIKLAIEISPYWLEAV
jgi:hypothetical protein